MKKHFVTGFPGFVATHLLRELAQKTDDQFILLVEQRFTDFAATRLQKENLSERCEVVVGDITDPKLGLDDARYETLSNEISYVWHLAAIYDLAVSETIAYKVNVMGTVHVMDFCEACSDLTAFNYISTCYVAGQRTGTIFEDELDEGQSHFNHYESTKFWAEVEVKRRTDSVPTKILRPAIVVGHSKTGETDKYDGPYYLLKILKRLPDWVPFPNLGDPNVKVNIIPIDYAVRAMVALGLSERGIGETFHIADPNPLRPPEIIRIALTALGKTHAIGTVPPRFVSLAVGNRRFERWLSTPKQVIDYFRHNATFDTTNARDILFEEDIVCPHLSAYLPVLIDYFENNPDQDFLDSRAL